MCLFTGQVGPPLYLYLMKKTNLTPPPWNNPVMQERTQFLCLAQKWRFLHLTNSI